MDETLQMTEGHPTVPESLPRQPAIDFFTRKADSLAEKIKRLETAKEKHHAIKLADLDSLGEFQEKETLYGRMAESIKQGDTEQIEEARQILEKMHADLIEKIISNNEERSRKEKELKNTDDKPFQEIQEAYFAALDTLKVVGKSGDWESRDRAFRLAEGIKIRMWNTPSGLLRKEINTLGISLESDAKEIGAVTQAAQSLRYPIQ